METAEAEGRLEGKCVEDGEKQQPSSENKVGFIHSTDLLLAADKNPTYKGRVGI